MTIEDFIKDCQKEGLTKLEAFEAFESWLEENIGKVLRSEVLDLFEKYWNS
jgi:hypothetical protein